MSWWRSQGLVRNEVPAVPPGLSLQPLPSVMTNLGLRGWGYPCSGPGAVPEVKVSLMLSSLAEIPESSQQGPRDGEGAGGSSLSAQVWDLPAWGPFPSYQQLEWAGGWRALPSHYPNGLLVLWPQARLSPPSVVCWRCRCCVLQQESPLLCPAS